MNEVKRNEIERGFKNSGYGVQIQDPEYNSNPGRTPNAELSDV
jgi:hypothetical protein